MNILAKLLIVLFIINITLDASNANPTKEEVSKLYVATFNRAPDADGLDYWTDPVRNGNLTLSQIAGSFFDQTETQALYPASTQNSDFIRSVYLNLFNREPDEAGWAYWLERLDSQSISKNNFILAVINGAQDNADGLDITILNNKNEVGLYFADAGLEDKDDAREALEMITAEYSTVTAVKKLIDEESLEPQDEPYYKYLWHLNSQNNILNSLGYLVDNDADISIEEAWDITLGNGVKVAVIDDGAELEHEDLSSNIVASYNADDDTSGGAFVPSEDFPSSHGSTCAGFISAPVNAKGIVGVAPESDMIIIKNESADDIATIRAFNYAQEQGAKVISCSWGTNNVSEAIVEKLKELYDAGITVLFASGNDNADLDDPGYDDESEVQWVIGVGSSSEVNDVTTYSNYGSAIEILSPGGDVELYSGILGLDKMGDNGDTNQLGLVNNNYSFTNGTSFSCPVAAGVVALMYAVNPGISPQEVRTILIQTADKIGETTYEQNGYDSQKRRAYGKINALKAVQQAQSLLD